MDKLFLTIEFMGFSMSRGDFPCRLHPGGENRKKLNFHTLFKAGNTEFEQNNP